MVIERLNFVMDKVLLCLTVDQYAGMWQDCSMTEELCHRKLRSCEEIEEHSDHKEEGCHWTVNYYDVIGECYNWIRVL